MRQARSTEASTRRALAVLAGLLALVALLVAPGAADALTWAGATTLSAPGELTQNDPATAMDATGDAVVAWANYHTTSFDCPCQVRAALRSAGHAFASPVTVGTNATGTDSLDGVDVAMDAAGDAVLVWEDGTPKQLGQITGEEHSVWASFRPAGGAFGTPKKISVTGSTSDGGGAPQVAMDSHGDATVAYISGLGWFATDPAPALQIVRRPAGGAFSSPAPLALASGGPWAFRLAESPNGHTALAFTWQADQTCAPAPCNPHGNADENVEVARASGPAAAFGTPAIVSKTVLWPGSGQGPSEDVADVAVDDKADVVAAYDETGAGAIFDPGTTRRDEEVTSDAGGAFSSPKSLGAAGKSFADRVAVAPSGEATTIFSDPGGVEWASRLSGGAFSARHLLSATAADDTLAASTGGTDLGGLAFTDHVAAALRPAGSSFGAPATVGALAAGKDAESLDGALDAVGDAAVLAWAETNDNGDPGAIRAALDGTPVTPPPATFTLGVARAGSGTGTVTSSPAGIACGATCSHAYTSGTAVTLTAAPASGSTFTGWSGACSGTGACHVTMSAARSVTATFAKTSTPPPPPPAAKRPTTRVTKMSVNGKKHNVTFRFKGGGGKGKLHFKCKLDRGKWSKCSSPKTYRGLKHKHGRHGHKVKHTFRVQAIDGRGLADKTPAVRRFSF